MDPELNSFLKEFQQPADTVLDKPLETKTDEEPEKETPVRRVELDEDGYPKNREGRRKRQEDERLRDEVTQLNERVKVLSSKWLELPLATTFRCPKVVVERSKGHAPGFRAWEKNKPGWTKLHASCAIASKEYHAKLTQRATLLETGAFVRG